MLAQLQRLTRILGQHLCRRPLAELALPEVGVEFFCHAVIDAVFGVLEVHPFAEGVEAVFVGVVVLGHGSVEGVWGLGVSGVRFVMGEVTWLPSETSLFFFGVWVTTLVCWRGICLGLC